MDLNKLNQDLLKEAEIVSTTASIPDFMNDIEKALKGSEKVTVSITQASHEEMPKGHDHNSWGWVKGQLSWNIEKEE